MLRSFFRSITGKSLIVLVVCLSLWHGWLAMAAPRKIDPEVYAAMERGRRIDVLVELKFPPERFHVLTFQRFGRVSGTRENTVELRGVQPKAIPEVSRFYWVRNVKLLPRP